RRIGREHCTKHVHGRFPFVVQFILSPVLTGLLVSNVIGFSAIGFLPHSGQGCCSTGAAFMSILPRTTRSPSPHVAHAGAAACSSCSMRRRTVIVPPEVAAGTPSSEMRLRTSPPARDIARTRV